MSESILAQPAPPADFRLSYGPDPLHIGDLRLPSGAGPHPLVVVVHGGFWRNRYDLEHIGHVCAALTARGLATWNIEYRRIGDPGGGWPGTFLDAGRATDYVRELAPRFNLDLDRTVTAGHSAGGHLALWLAARPRLDPASELATPDPLRVRGAVSLAGVADLRAAYDLRLSQRVVVELLDGSPDAVPARYASASPAELLPLGVPQVLIHGTSDGPVPFQISADYAARAASLGDQASLIPLEGAHHFELIDPGSREWPTVEQAIVDAVGGGR
jgi:acetyl esterase/lipase